MAVIHAYKPLRSPAQDFPMCAVCNQRPEAPIHDTDDAICTDIDIVLTEESTSA